jgi:2-methylcitrate dehydratase PrpD
MSEGNAQASTGLFRHLANFSCRAYLGVPPEVSKEAKLSILDTVGCMVAGSTAPETHRFLQAELELSEGLGVASVVGATKRFSTSAAARLNGYAGDLFELNDLTGGHASIAVVTAALATAEANGVAGAQLVDAVVVGIEVTSRIYAAYYPTMKPYEEVGITPPGIPSTIGAAAAISRVCELSEEQTAEALAIAGTLAGWCPAEVIFGNGGTIKPILFGAWPATVAMQAVAYARAGLTGPASLLESRIGLYATLAKSFDSSAILEPLRWHLASPRRKRHACCGYIHSALDAVLALRAEGVRLADAALIEVRMPSYIIPGVSKNGPPSSPNSARFHAEYCIALALEGEELIVPDHSLDFAKHLKRVGTTMKCVNLTADDSLTHYHQSIVRGLDARGNEIFRRRVDAPRGAPGDPMSHDEVRKKFFILTQDALEPQAQRAFVDRVDSLEHETECGWLIGTFSHPTEI